MYLHIYGLSGVEKKNDQTKKSYFGASNRKNATKDMLEYDYRLHAMAGKKRIKRSYKR